MLEMHKAVQKEIVNLAYRGFFFFGGGGRNLFGLSLLDIKLF